MIFVNYSCFFSKKSCFFLIQDKQNDFLFYLWEICAIEAKEMQSTIRRKDGVVMNIPELSTALSSSRLLNQVGTAMLSKSLDDAESAGAGMIQMMDRSMELSVNPSVGSNIDVLI